MKLRQVIIDYRNRMKISQREFSRRCDLSNTYISFIEKEINPKTGKPIVPTLEQYKKLANGMDISLNQLFELLDDDAPVDIGFHVPSADDDPQIRIVIDMMEKMTEEQKALVVSLVRSVFSHPTH